MIGMGETKFEKKPQVTKSQGLAVIFGVARIFIIL
jgi:hypothetical protein